MSYSVFPQVFFIVAASLAYFYLSARSRFEGKEKRFANTCSIFLVVFITVLLYLAFVVLVSIPVCMGLKLRKKGA